MFDVRRPWLVVALTALALATPAHAADRGAAKAPMDQGVAALFNGNPTEARIRLLTAIQAAPDWPLPRAVQARVMLALGDGPGAEAELRGAIERGMPKAQVAHLMAHAALLQGDTARALDEAATEGPSPISNAYAARISARALMAQGDFDGAGQAFDRAMALTPQSSSLWSDIGRFRQVAGNTGGAVDAARRAVELNPANNDALMLTGELLRGQFGLVAAIPWFERVLAADPNNLTALGELAATLGDAGRARDMLAVTRKMLSVDPDNPKAYFIQAVLAARAGKHDLARAMLYRTNNRLDSVPAVMLLTAVLDLKAGASEQAISRLEDLVKAQPTNLKAKRLLGTAMWRAGDAQSAISVLGPMANRPDADSYTLSVIGRAYEEQGDRESAAAYLDRAAAPVRGEPVPFAMTAGLIKLARENAGDDGNADVAIPRISRMIAAGQAGAALDKALALQRDNRGAPAAHVLVGDALMALGKPKEAAAAYQNAASIRFSEPVALRFIDALRKSGDDVAALRALDMFLGQNPRSISGLLLAADHFMGSGDWDRAIGILEGLRIRIGNRDATLLGNLGWAWFNKRDFAKAVRFSGAAYAMSPANPALSNSYGWILFRSGKDKALGLKLLTKAAAIAPEHPGLAWQLGQALVESGRGAAARPYLQKAATSANFADQKAAAAMLAGL